MIGQWNSSINKVLGNLELLREAKGMLCFTLFVLVKSYAPGLASAWLKNAFLQASSSVTWDRVGVLCVCACVSSYSSRRIRALCPTTCGCKEALTGSLVAVSSKYGCPVTLGAYGHDFGRVFNEYLDKYKICVYIISHIYSPLDVQSPPPSFNPR